MIGVVIPYFQREPGILSNALRSVFASEGVNDVCVLVVDDESPIPAQDEIRRLGNTRYPIKIIHQRNSGPGGARNTGLENLPEEVRYIAFLDSDDTWDTQHLRNAIFALETGFDVYFCDHIQLGSDESAFRRAGRINPNKHRNIAGQPDIHEFEGDMFDQIITGNIIGTSTVVLDRWKFGALRFRTDLTSAGEDYLFWLDLANKGARFAFGATPSVFYGKGVNVYAGSGWGTEGHARRIVHELIYRKTLLSLFKLNQSQSDLVKGAIRGLGKAFVADCLHRVAHRKDLDWKLVSAMRAMEPRILLWLVEAVFGKAVQVIRRQSNSLN